GEGTSYTGSGDYLSHQRERPRGTACRGVTAFVAQTRKEVHVSSFEQLRRECSRSSTAAYRREEMDFAIRLQRRAETARGHDVVVGALQTRCQGIPTAAKPPEAGKSTVQGRSH